MQNQISDELFNVVIKMNPKLTLSELEEYFFNKIVLENFNYQFEDKSLLLKAFVHQSFSHEIKLELENFERLEFLGDSVLSLVISDYLFKNYDLNREGVLSKLRSSIVKEDTLYELAKFLKIQNFVLVGRGELLNQGYLKKSILSDCFEALLGAIYLDSGFVAVKEVLLAVIEEFEKQVFPIFVKDASKVQDAKTKLQELVFKKHRVYPTYESKVLDDLGMYEVRLKVKDRTILTTTNDSKKRAMIYLAEESIAKELY